MRGAHRNHALTVMNNVHRPEPGGARSLPDRSSEHPSFVVFEGVSLAYDDKVILDDVSFDLIRGRTKFVLGASGAGKSTLLKLVLGLIRPDSGLIWVSGKYVNRLNEQELRSVRAEIGMVFQENALFDSLTVRENVAYRLYEEEGLSAREADRRAEDTLGFVGLAGFGDRMPAELSGGQRRRVGIARAMAFKPLLILYDEPTTGLDPPQAGDEDAIVFTPTLVKRGPGPRPVRAVN